MASISQDLLPIPVFTDDIALLADSAQQMQAMLFVCEKWAREYRMTSSLKKCEIVAAIWSGPN
jgi:hypothetical protein